ncbi:MAG TPA: response regulator, partial [Gammaproteobacteria bacterium]|nr:response regulator [Gammaproteobacteria bacterium]
KARALGILGFLTKPVDPEELTKLIGELWIKDRTAHLA